MRKTISKQFKCMEKIVRILVVRVLRSFGHNPDYDLGKPRATGAGAHGSNIIQYRPTSSNTFEHYREISNMAGHFQT